MNIYYCDVRNINQTQFDALINKLPAALKSEVMSFKNDVDRKTRLLARVMLLNSLKQTGVEHFINLQKKSIYGKPFIEGWDFFNASHSGDYVVLAHDLKPLGVDIEGMKDIDVAELDYLLHADERNYIAQATNKTEAFYHIWVKKEAFLKATGQGLTTNLSKFNTANNSINFAGDNWYFYYLTIATTYQCYLCTPSIGLDCEILEFDERMLNNLLR